MKLFLLVLLFILSGCSSFSSDLKLKEAMAYGTLIELNNFDTSIEKELLIRLYKVPNFSESCFIETHGICNYSYYLSVSTFDEVPDVSVSKLDFTGDITATKWRLVETSDYAEIEISYSKYTSEALNNNSNLKNIIKNKVLKVSLDNVVVSSM